MFKVTKMERILSLHYQNAKDGHGIYQETWFGILFWCCIIFLGFAGFVLLKYWKKIHVAIKLFYADWIFLLILRVAFFADVFARYPTEVYVALEFLPVFWITLIAPGILIYMFIRLISRVIAIVRREKESKEHHQ